MRKLRGCHFRRRQLEMVDGQKDAPESGFAEQRKIKDSAAPRSTWAAMAIGALVGAAIGLMTLVIFPAVPLLMVAGALIGGVLGGFVGMGAGQEMVHASSGAQDSRRVLLMLRESDPMRARLALRLLEEANAQSVAVDQQG